MQANTHARLDIRSSLPRSRASVGCIAILTTRLLNTELVPRKSLEVPGDVNTTLRWRTVNSQLIQSTCPESLAHSMKTSRLEAFSDGVLAIIITIMVLE